MLRKLSVSSLSDTLRLKDTISLPNNRLIPNCQSLYAKYRLSSDGDPFIHHLRMQEAPLSLLRLSSEDLFEQTSVDGPIPPALGANPRFRSIHALLPHLLPSSLSAFVVDLTLTNIRFRTLDDLFHLSLELTRQQPWKILRF